MSNDTLEFLSAADRTRVLVMRNQGRTTRHALIAFAVTMMLGMAAFSLWLG